jgi:hypothetical protein
MLRTRTLTSWAPVFLLLAGCSDPLQTQKAKEPPKPPEPVSAQYAFHQMYVAARSWAPDAQPLQLTNIRLDEVKAEAGTAGAWQATFVSDKLGRAKTYTYSVIEGQGNLHKGVFGGHDEGWSGPRGQARPFLPPAFKVDAAQAYKTAMKHGAEYARKNPEMPINFLLEKTPRFPNPAWRVIWGESIGTSNYSIVVDATTGDYLTTLR